MQDTKIICTIGPASSSPEMLTKLHDAGMSIARINMSHGTHDDHRKVIDTIKAVNEELSTPLGLLLDTKGPEIRTGSNSMDLKEGQEIVITLKEPAPNTLFIDYSDLIHDVAVDNTILVDNGLIHLKILSMSQQDQTITCQVEHGGFVKGYRHVNLPGIKVNLDSITEQDVLDLKFGREHDFDFFALSFVRSAQVIDRARAILGPHVRRCQVYAKIENVEGLGNVDEIIDIADGVMIARGDLGIEIPPEQLPYIQRQIATKCAKKGKRSIVATHLLESMIENPMPTRAEVSDVANAIYEEVDAIMLSGETAVGKYPEQCVKYLSRIAKTTEVHESLELGKGLEVTSRKQRLAQTAVRFAEDYGCKGLIILTQFGTTARFVSNCRSKQDTFAFTNNRKTHQLMTIMRNIRPIFIEFSSDHEETLMRAFRILHKISHITPDDEVVLISDMRTDCGVIDSIQVRPARANLHSEVKPLFSN